MEEILAQRIEKRKYLDAVQRCMAYVLFAGVIMMVLQAFFLLSMVGKISNFISSDSSDHFMYYSQIYLKFCSMLLTLVLLGYFGLRIYKAVYFKEYDVKGFFARNAMIIPLFAMLIWAFIALYQSPDFEKSLYGSGYINEGFFTVLQYSTVFLAAYIVKDELKFSKEAVLWTFVVLASIICFIIWGSQAVNYSLGYKRLNGVFNNSNHYGYFLAMSTTAAFALMVYTKDIKKLSVLAVMLALNVHNLLYCNTLGANLAFIGGIVFVVCSGYMSKRIYTSSLLVAFLVSGAVVLIDEASGATHMWESYETLFRDLGFIADHAAGEDVNIDIVGTGRYALWTRTIEVIKKVPWFGKGLDLYYRNNIYDKTLDVPHNEYLAIASNIGIPGLVMYLLTIVWWFAQAVQQRRNLSPYDLVMLATAFAYMVSAFTGNSFTYTYPYFLIFFAMSMQHNDPVPQKYEQLQKNNTPEEMQKRAQEAQEKSAQNK